jgi:hypothetical protein
VPPSTIAQFPDNDPIALSETDGTDEAGDSTIK